jgi:hypothetical protein
MNHPELTRQALSILRNGENFQWYAIALLAFALYVYATEFERKNWNGIAAGLSLYAVHWFYEILNALIQHFSGHALWTVPTGTSYLLLIGVGWELSVMFSVAGLLLSKLLPDDRKLKILGLPNRLLFVVGNAAFFSIFEIFLASTPAFHWVYPWWGSFTVFITTYIPFFLAAVWAYDAPAAARFRFIAGLAAVDLLMLMLFAGVLGWI